MDKQNLKNLLPMIVATGRTLTLTRDQYLPTVDVWLDEPELELRRTCWPPEYLGPNQWFFGFRANPVHELVSLKWQEVRKLFGVSIRVKTAYRIKAGQVFRLDVPTVGQTWIRAIDHYPRRLGD